jgi:hypothetical protein
MKPMAQNNDRRIWPVRHVLSAPYTWGTPQIHSLEVLRCLIKSEI